MSSPVSLEEPYRNRGLPHFEIPEADLSDIRGTVADLTAAVSSAIRDRTMLAPFEPFAEALLALQRPAMSPIGGMEPTSSEPRYGLADIESACARAEAGSPEHSAWLHVDKEAALARARAMNAQPERKHLHSLLHNVPVGLKDMFDRRGSVAGWGASFRMSAPAATRDSAVVERLEAAGAVIIGALHMAECAMSPTGLNEYLGHGTKPHNRYHVSGGSSSGAGMAVGAGDVPLAIGSDTGGSVRLPAALCGVTGLKPTQFRVSAAGAMPLAPSMDCIGPLASTADLCGLAFAAIAGPDINDPTCVNLPAPQAGAWRNRQASMFTLAVPRFTSSELLSEEMLLTLNHTKDTLADAGMRIIEVEVPDFTLLGKLASVILAVESACIHRANLEHQPHVYGRQVRRRLSRGLLLDGMTFHDAQRLRASLLRDFLSRYISDADALLLPVTPHGAPRLADTVGEDQSRLETEFGKLSYWTRGINYIGLPGLSVPAGKTATGLPLGVQFVGAPFDEERLLAIGDIFQNS